MYRHHQRHLHRSTTCVKTRAGSTTPIVCGRGVKQGCPLSPILFNFVMEAVIRAVEEVPDAGYKIANSSITSLAYADDYVCSRPLGHRCN